MGGPHAKAQFADMYKEICDHLLKISDGFSASKVKIFEDYITLVYVLCSYTCM